MSETSRITLAIQRFVQEITNLPVNHSVDNALENALVAEHEIRLLFASDPQNLQLKNLFLGLINVFSLHPAARRHRERRINPDTTDYCDRHIFPLSEHQRRLDLMPSTVPNIEAFMRNWEIFTHRALSKMTSKDWRNVVVAGGSVLACLASGPNVSAKRMNEFYQSDVYRSSDIDLFLWGMTPREAEAKMKDIYHAVCEAAPWKVTCVRKANTVSIHSESECGFRPIQIILRLYQSPAEILAGFDIDAACCAFDGKRVWINPRFLTALVRQANTVDITRRSPSYEVRLAKYAERGFEILVPNLRREQIKPWIYSRDLSAFPNGLARLLVLEAAYFKPKLYMRLKFPHAHRLEKSFCKDMARQANDLPANNYDGNLGWAQIPYGKFWNANQIEKLIAKKDAWVNSPFNPYNQGENQHRHIFFAGTMEECLGNFCPDCNNNDGESEVASTGLGVYIKGRVRFMTDNPGQQLATGSFKPIEIGDWECEAYEEGNQDVGGSGGQYDGSANAT